MNALVVTVPILPGKLAAWKNFVSALLDERRTEYEAAIADGSLSRLRVWHARGPDGTDAAVVLFEGETPELFLGRIAQGDDAFSAWFRDGLVEAHAMDLSMPPPPPPNLEIDIGSATVYSSVHLRAQVSAPGAT